MPNLTGKLLVASPHLTDRNFFRSVVLILRHEPSDAFGLVLNRPTDYRLSESLEDVEDIQLAKDTNLFWGGPVEGPLVALHREASLGDFAAVGDVFATMDEQNLLTLFRRGDEQCRYFAGYSGWGEGQLDTELEVGGWIVTDMIVEDVFKDGDELWETIVQRVGRDIMSRVVAMGNDVDASMN